jgi:hypothetical protein
MDDLTRQIEELQARVTALQEALHAGIDGPGAFDCQAAREVLRRPEGTSSSIPDLLGTDVV